jgi:site-specific DNA-methyltransferase (adenine-specific)
VGVELRCGDALAVLRTLEAGSVSHIVTDPPYGQSNEAYDRGVPPEVWRECYRVAKPDAALISFAGGPTYHRIASDIEAAGWQVRQMWGWVYRNGFITSAYPSEGFDRLAPAFDPICYATKGKVLLNLNREGSGRWRRNRNEDERCSWSERSGERAATALGRWPRALVAEPMLGEEFQYFALNPNSPGLRGEKVGHPNQKPLALMLWIVRKLPRGGVVLDPYLGSGTTGLASEACGFDFIGIDNDPECIEMAGARFAGPSMPLFNSASSTGQDAELSTPYLSGLCL